MPGPVTIAVAGPDDIDDLTSLRLAWSPADSAAAATAFSTTFAAWLHTVSGQRIFWIARRDGTPIGMVNLVLFDRMPVPGRESGGWGYLSNMYVVEHERNAGIGALLAAAVIDRADDLGLDRVVLKPSVRSVPFYLRAGFRSENELLVRPRNGGI